jgi:FG-GAP-like repeat/Abnormal spindle-like microcephaly-assoc'd, ASPM-SPD-2-Hydin
MLRRLLGSVLAVALISMAAEGQTTVDGDSAISFMPSNLQFGFTAVGQTSAPQPVIIANNGESPLLINSISITGDFSETHDCPSSLAPNATCTVTVLFTPTALLLRDGLLTVVDDASGSPHSVALGGVGANPQLTATQSLVFGSQTIFTASASLGILLRNTSSTAVTLTSIFTNSEFAASPDDCSTLPPDSACTLSVTFRPTSVGLRAGTLTITSSGIGSPNVVALSGTGLVGGVSLSSALVSFPADLVGTSSPSRVVSLANQGAGPLTIFGIATSGNFTQTNNCGTSLPVGDTCSIKVVFSPAAEGPRSGSLTVTSDGSGSPQSIALEGTGLAALPTPVIAAMNPNSRAVGDSGVTLIITGSGFSSASVVLWNGIVHPSTFVDANTITVALTPSDFAARGTVPVSIFNPGAGGGVSNKAGFVVYLPLTLSTNDLIYDRLRNRVYASVAATSPFLANTLTTVDPVTGTLGNSVPIGSDPAKLAISGDSSVLYVALEDSAEVRPVQIASQTPGTAFTLGGEPQRPYSAEDIAVSPGSPGTIAVSRRAMGSPRHEGVAIFDNGVMRPATTPDQTGSNLIEFSNSPSTLYGYNNESTESGFRTMSVSPSGVVVTNVQQNLISGPAVDMQFENGRIYASSGSVIDPVSRTLLGTFSIPPGQSPGTDASRGVVADSKLKRAFFLIVDPTSVRILAFDMDTFAQTGSLTLPPQGSPTSIGSLVRWGERGLAFRSGSQVFLFEIPENWLPPRAVSRDFNGDKKSDVLWRNVAGDVSMWQLNGSAISSDSLVANIWTGWTIAGSGDFNGDEKADVLWRGPGGEVVVWLMNGATVSSYGVAGNPPASWTVAAVGDFDGDGKADVLWRDTSGTVALWLMNGTAMTSSTVISNIWTGWTIAGAADFDGDARADVLWRSVSGDVALWLMNGATVSNSTVIGNIWTGWTIAGTGDFDGDARADILWRDVDGNVAIWQMNGPVVLKSTIVANIWTDWAIVGTGDFNGDGKADILWRDTSGNVAIWLMDGTTISSFAAMGNVSDRMSQ